MIMKKFNYNISLAERSRLAKENLKNMPTATLDLLQERWEMVRQKSKAKHRKKK